MNNQGEEEVFKASLSRDTIPKLAADDIMSVAHDKLKMTLKTYESFKRKLRDDKAVQEYVDSYNEKYRKVKSIMENLDKVTIEDDKEEKKTPEAEKEQPSDNASAEALLDELAMSLVNINAEVLKTYVLFNPRAIKVPFMVKLRHGAQKYRMQCAEDRANERFEEFKAGIKTALEFGKDANEKVVVPMVATHDLEGDFTVAKLEKMRDGQRKLNNAEKPQQAPTQTPEGLGIEESLRARAAGKLGKPSPAQKEAAEEGLKRTDEVQLAFLRRAQQKNLGVPTAEQVKEAERGIEATKGIMKDPAESVEAGFEAIARQRAKRKQQETDLQDKRIQAHQEQLDIRTAQKMLQTLRDGRKLFAEFEDPDKLRLYDEAMERETKNFERLLGVSLAAPVDDIEPIENPAVKEEKDPAVVAQEKHAETQADIEAAFVGPEADKRFADQEERSYFQALRGPNGENLTAKELLERKENTEYLSGMYGQGEQREVLERVLKIPEVAKKVEEVREQIRKEKEQTNETVIPEKAAQDTKVGESNLTQVSTGKLTDNQLKDELIKRGMVPVNPDVLKSILADRLKADYELQDSINSKVPNEVLAKRLNKYLTSAENVGGQIVPEDVKERRILEARMQEEVPQALLNQRVAKHNAEDSRNRSIPVEVLEDAIEKVVRNQREREARELLSAAESAFVTESASQRDKVQADIQSYADRKKAELDEALAKKRRERIERIKNVIDPKGEMSLEEFNIWMTKQEESLRQNPSLGNVSDHDLNQIIMDKNTPDKAPDDTTKITAEPVGPATIPEETPAVQNKTEQLKVNIIEESSSHGFSTGNKQRPIKIPPKNLRNLHTTVTAATPYLEGLKRELSEMKEELIRKHGHSSKSLRTLAAAMNPHDDDPIVQSARMALHDELMAGSDKNYTIKNQDYMNEVFNDPENVQKVEEAERDSNANFQLSSPVTETPEQRENYRDSLQKAIYLQQGYNQAPAYSGVNPSEYTATDIPSVDAGPSMERRR